MTPSLLDSRATLYDLLNVGLDGVDAVYDHEPGREASGPCYVTVALERLTTTEQVWAVRVYSQWADGLEDATTTLLGATEAVDDLLSTQTYGPSSWELGAIDDLQALVARCFVDVPRTTF